MRDVVGVLLVYRTWTTAFLTVAFLRLAPRARREDELLRLEFGARWEANRRWQTPCPTPA